MFTSEKAVSRTPPELGQNYVLSVTAASANTTIDAGWAGQYVTVIAEGADLWYAFADAAGTISPTTSYPANTTTNCFYLPAGTSQDFFLPEDGSRRVLHYITRAGTSILRCALTSELGAQYNRS